MKKYNISQKFLISALALTCGLLIAACSPPKKDSPTGFILPPGDAMKGQTTFAALACINCHTVQGVTFTTNDTINPDLVVQLGGPQVKVKTYGQLVTAIIHPNSSILRNEDRYVDQQGESLMPNYAELMTVQQMTDLVTFLSGHYEKIEPPKNEFYSPDFPYNWNMP
ncbi:c-type cytochrome [Coraliomargarita sp. W4R72]